MPLELNAAPVALARDVWLLPGFASSGPLRAEIERLAAAARFRVMSVPGGKPMSVAMTNCGRYGWVSDAGGYRYSPTDPETGRPWPAMPALFLATARDAALAAGWPDFAPDACLVNRYVAGSRLGLHQDRNEEDLAQPIVSVSIGAPCRFVLGGMRREDPVRSVALADGDVMVWGGAARLVYHGVRPLRPHGPADPLRYNLTFRKARR